MSENHPTPRRNTATLDSKKPAGAAPGTMSEIDLRAHGITVATVGRNLAPAKLYADAIFYGEGSVVAATGALMAYSGEKTGRAPADKRVVRRPETEHEVWWGPVNIEFSEESFNQSRNTALDYLNAYDRLYCIDGYAGWDEKYQIKVRVICARPYHALFMHNMLIRPTEEQLADFGEPDCVIYNAGAHPADTSIDGVETTTSVALSLEQRQLVILGTEYAGEMKKGVFTLMNYLMPKSGHVSMHCSATSDPKTGSSSVLFGLSGTGKTTLSADPNRPLVGDDEHVWTDDGIFNIEGGCYAKTIGLTREAEPTIYDALKFGAVLENVTYDKNTHEIDYTDDSITENTRGAYPIEFIQNAKVPCVTGHPTHILFLTCDAFGVLPPASKLTPEQAEYHFISGYTAKVAGTEVGVTEPKATFSPCFGGPFLVWHPGKYADLLSKQIRKYDSHVWLVNTGWSGGAYGTGSRMKLSYTRSIIDAIYSGELEKAPTQPDPVFNIEVVTSCSNVPDEILVPRNTWADKAAFDETAKKLAGLFTDNFKKYADGVSEAVRNAGPTA